MTEPKSFSYTTHLDIKFDPLALIDVDQLAKSITDQWYNQTLCRVNDSVVRLGVSRNACFLVKGFAANSPRR